jgi:hypothetical protein
MSASSILLRIVTGQDRKWTYDVTFEERKCNHCSSGEVISVTQPECVYLLPSVSSMQCACAILSSVAYPDLQYFSTLSHTRHDFRKKLLKTKCVFWFSIQLSSETFLTLGRNERDMIINVYWSSREVPVILVRFQWNLNFLSKGSKNLQILNFMKIRPVWAELSHADRRTDMTKLIAAFGNFATASKNETSD